LHPSKDETVFAHTYHAMPEVGGARSAAPEMGGDTVAVRGEVLKQIEAERTGGRVGSSLQAEVVVNLPADQAGADCSRRVTNCDSS
jgi:isoleucyl-tRNA synthetase